MSEVSLTVVLPVESYAVLLAAANESGISVSDFANRILTSARNGLSSRRRCIWIGMTRAR